MKNWVTSDPMMPGASAVTVTFAGGEAVPARGNSGLRPVENPEGTLNHMQAVDLDPLDFPGRELKPGLTMTVNGESRRIERIEKSRSRGGAGWDTTRCILATGG